MALDPRSRDRTPRRRACAGWLAAACALTIGVATSASGAAGSAEGVLRGTVTCRAVRDCQGAVVYVEQVPGQSYRPRGEAILDQRKLTFVPHVLTVVTGTTVVFRNSDDVWHNIFSTSPAKRFNLGTYAKGVDKRLVLDKPGVVELLCNVHPEMSGFIVVVDTPHTTHVEPDGRYELGGLPEGTYTVVAWHEALKPSRRQVTLRSGEAFVVDFVLGR